MSDQDTQNLWYLARDGQQYGPITDAELAKLVELGHLRDNDLVWNPSFTDWQPASVAQAAFAAKPEPAPPATSPQPPAGDPSPHAEDPTPTTAPPYDASGGAAAASPHAPATGAVAGDAGRQGQPTDTTQPIDQRATSAGRSRSAPTAEAWAEAARAASERGAHANPDRFATGSPAAAAGAGPAGRPGAAAGATAGDAAQRAGAAGTWPTSQPASFGAGAAATGTGAMANAGRPMARPQAEPQMPMVDPRAKRFDDEDDDDDHEYDDGGGSSVVGILVRVAAVAVALILIGGAAWFAYQNRDDLMRMTGLEAETANDPVVVSANPQARAVRAEPAAAQNAGNGGGTGPVERPLEPLPLLDQTFWGEIAKSFPNWADERKTEALAIQRKSRGKDEASRYLIKEIAGLRRTHANDALAASPTVLRRLASAFLENLRKLTGKSPDACYDFISRGETSPEIIPMLDDPEVGPSLVKQLRFIAEAIADGKADPQTYLPPRQADYKVISSELTKMGWTNADMQLFGDPQALSQAKPQKVCQLVTDWFSAQLLVSDPKVQARLLVQSLRPVVAG